MPRGKSKEDRAMLEMALIGYRHEREKIDTTIRELKDRLKGNQAGTAKATGGKRVMSAAARKRIAAAQKKRWAERRKLGAAD